MLIDKEAYINAVDADHTSALIYAASNGNISNEFHIRSLTPAMKKHSVDFGDTSNQK